MQAQLPHEMSGKNQAAPAEERDINDLFDEIVLTEERSAQEGYEEGFAEGQKQGNHEGYQLGYAQGVQLGEELGAIYGAVIAHQQSNHTEKINRTLQHLREAIEIFPRDNPADADIIGAVEHIRTLDKQLRAMLGTKYKTTNNTSSENTVQEKKDYSF